MAKIDKNNLTKEEWRVIRDRRRAEKETQKLLKNINPVQQEKIKEEKSISSERIVLCLKHGQKYSSDYVNKLYNACKRNSTKPFKMVCLTDDPLGINPDVDTLPLPADLTGWWCKPYMFSKELPLVGTVLYLDLDVVIAGNIDILFDFEPNHWCTVRDFTRAMRKEWKKYNSSVIKFKAGELDHIWQGFKKDAKNIMRRLHGDQDWLWEAGQRKAKYFPDRYVMSWKWEIRETKNFAPGGVKGNRKLAKIEDVTPPAGCIVCVFHGDPNPHNCDDPWVKENWQ